MWDSPGWFALSAWCVALGIHQVDSADGWATVLLGGAWCGLGGYLFARIRSTDQ